MRPLSVQRVCHSIPTAALVASFALSSGCSDGGDEKEKGSSSPDGTGDVNYCNPDDWEGPWRAGECSYVIKDGDDIILSGDCKEEASYAVTPTATGASFSFLMENYSATDEDPDGDGIFEDVDGALIYYGLEWEEVEGIAFGANDELPGTDSLVSVDVLRHTVTDLLDSASSNFLAEDLEWLSSGGCRIDSEDGPDEDVLEFDYIIESATKVCAWEPNDFYEVHETYDLDGSITARCRGSRGPSIVDGEMVENDAVLTISIKF